VALLAAIAGAIAGSGAETEGERGDRRAAPERPVDRLSLEQQVGQLLVLSFSGAKVPDYVRDILREGRAAGVVLFQSNARSRRQVRSLTRRLQRAAQGRALVATDQEGGPIRIFSFADPVDGQAAHGTVRKAAAAARDGARDLARVGVNVNLAPVADIGVPGGSAVGPRVYPGESREVSALVRASIREHGRGGVATTPKHFPGFGSAQGNTDDEPVTIDAPREQILGRDVEPFRAAIAAGAPLLMASHALYPALDGRRIASQSQPVLGDLLRRRLGFRGVVVTDSIEADAVLARSSVETAAVRSVAAGADIVLMTGPGSFDGVRDRLLARARRSPRFRRRVEESAERVLVLKDRMGLGRSPRRSSAR
jgi:beta-N-acetylhexosaminidase